MKNSAQRIRTNHVGRLPVTSGFEETCHGAPHPGHRPAPVQMSQEDCEQLFGGGAKMLRVGDCYENRSHAA